MVAIMNWATNRNVSVSFVREVVGYIANHYCLAFVREVVRDVVGYIVDHYCLAFVREVVGYNHFSNKCQAVMVDNVTNHFSNKCQAVMVDNVTTHIMNHFSNKC
jgi:hypothetical protein